jgi:hypothetical protein
MRYEMSPWRNVDELPMWGPLNQGWLPLTDQPNVVVGSQDISGYFEGPISTMQVIAYEVDHCMAGLIHMAKTFCPELQIIRNVFSNVGYSLFAEQRDYTIDVDFAPPPREGEDGGLEYSLSITGGSAW